MPLRIPDKLPAIDILKKENIFVMDSSRAHTQDIRPLHIVILNLMPLKITTETDLIRLLSNTPLQMDITFMKLKSHTPKNTPIEHMMAFYKDFDVLKDKKFDGMIITGAPVENYAFEEVTYWEEVTKILHGHAIMSPAHYIYAGLHRQGSTIIMAYQNIHCQRRCSVCSSNTHSCRFYPYSEALTTTSTCHRADTQRYANRILRQHQAYSS